jgi:hypothetical protein
MTPPARIPASVHPAGRDPDWTAHGNQRGGDTGTGSPQSRNDLIGCAEQTVPTAGASGIPSPCRREGAGTHPEAA